MSETKNIASKLIGLTVQTDGRGKINIPEKGIEIETIKEGEPTISIPLVPNRERDMGR